MEKTIILTIVLIVNVLANDVKFYNPSFDCSKVKKGSVEYKICTDEKLSQLDTNLSKIYNSFYFITKEIKADQRAWIKQRNQCQETNCIKGAYTTRVEELTTSLDNQKTFPKLYLDAMKEAQKNMQIVWNPIIFSKQERIDAGLKFKDDLFRFKEISFKPPLIKNVPYNDPKLKKVLGVCYFYRFDLEIEEMPSPKYISNGRKYWVEDERKPLRDINVSVWKTYAKDKEWLFIKPTNSGYAYLVDTEVCQQERLKNTLVDALNYDRERVKRSELGRHNAFIVKYKNQEYIFEALIREWGIDLYMFEILTSENSNIYFTGLSQACIPFEKITKPNQGEK